MRQSKIWAIRTKGWVEFRRGSKPKLKTTTAVVKTRVEVRSRDYRWSGNQSFYDFSDHRTPRYRFQNKTLTTSIYVNGTPFSWMPYRQFSRKFGSLRDGEFTEVTKDSANI